MTISPYTRHLLKDFIIVIFSIIVALILVKTHAIEELLLSISGFVVWGSLIAGMFFTSIFTVVPAAVALANIASESGLPVVVALFGGIGAMLGDYVIYRFVKGSVSEDIMGVLKEAPRDRLKAMLARPMFRWVLFMIGGFIIASPLPDELGLVFMGISKMETKYFMMLSFAFNFVGILLIGLIVS